MPNIDGQKNYVNLTKGLVTEVNPLNFPEGATVDEVNMNVDFSTLSRVKRKGLTSEGETQQTFNTLTTATDAFKTFIWKNAANLSRNSILVVQSGKTLSFFKATVDNISGTQFPFTYDLDNSRPAGKLGIVDARCNFCIVSGALLVTERNMNPTLIKYISSSNTIEVESIDIRVRDIFGVDDGLANSERPASLTDEHNYNLLNQGWYSQRRATTAPSNAVDLISNHFSNTGAYPSNADISYQGLKEDANGDLLFDSPTLNEQPFGNTPAPKGHYIFSAWEIDRQDKISNRFEDGSTFDDFTTQPSAGPLP